MLPCFFSISARDTCNYDFHYFWERNCTRYSKRCSLCEYVPFEVSSLGCQSCVSRVARQQRTADERNKPMFRGFTWVSWLNGIPSPFWRDRLIQAHAERRQWARIYKLEDVSCTLSTIPTPSCFPPCTSLYLPCSSRCLHPSRPSLAALLTEMQVGHYLDLGCNSSLTLSFGQ